MRPCVDHLVLSLWPRWETKNTYKMCTCSSGYLVNYSYDKYLSLCLFARPTVHSVNSGHLLSAHPLLNLNSGHVTPRPRRNANAVGEETSHVNTEAIEPCEKWGPRYCGPSALPAIIFNVLTHHFFFLFLCILN